MGIGRPSSFTEEKAAEICARLTTGESLRQICEGAEMPAFQTVFRWLQQQPAFREQYAHAREVQGHANADRAIAEALTAGDAQLGRLRYDALRWHASKMVPKVYGDKVTQEHTGEGGGPVRVVVEVEIGGPEAKAEGSEPA